MKILRKNISLLLMVLFELICGVLLLLSPEGFTKSLIIFFGLLFLVIGAIHLIRYLRNKGTDEANPVLLGSAVASLIIGAVFALGSNYIMGLFPIFAMVYGIVLIISGVYKAYFFFQTRKFTGQASIVYLISAAAAVILGLVIVRNPFETTVILWQFTGISMIIEAVADTAAVIHSLAKNQSE